MFSASKIRPRIIANLQHHPSSNVTLLQLFIDFWEIFERTNENLRLHNSSRDKLDRILALFETSHEITLDLQPLDDNLRHRGFNVPTTRRYANTAKRAADPEHRSSLCKRGR